jgi:hypothetical protein
MDQFHKPDGSGNVQGDSKGMPDKGTSTGMNGDTYGAGLGVDDTNSMGKVGGTDSDKMSDVMNHKPTKL